MGRTPSYYVGLVVSLLSLWFLPSMLRTFVHSPPILLAAASTAIGILILFAHFLGATDAIYRSDYWVDRPVKLIYLAVLFATFAGRPTWRRRLEISYMIGWLVFVLAVIGLSATGQQQIVENASIRRVSALHMNANEQSLLAGFGMLVCLIASLQRTSWWKLGGLAVAFAAGTYVFLLGSSRTGVVCLACCLPLCLLLTPSNRQLRRRPTAWRWGVTVAVLIAAAIWTVISSSESVHQLQSLQTRIESSTNKMEYGERDVLARRTLELVVDNPQGIGIGRTLDFLDDADPHNGYLKVLAENGVLGALLWLAALSWAARNAWQWARIAGDLIPIVGLAFFGIGALAGQSLIHTPFWFFFGLAAAPPEPAKRVREARNTAERGSRSPP